MRTLRRRLPSGLRPAFFPTAVLAALAALALPAAAQPTALSVNISSREEVRQFYRGLYRASDNVPIGWTGNYAAGNAGDTSSAFKEATRLRINFFRALAGLPADIRFLPEYSAKSQRAALLQSVNALVGNEIALNHTPPSSWTFFSADGAEGSAKSNLSYGTVGPVAISSYIADAGPTNAAVGHRRWLFYPQTLRMGTGDVPGDGTPARGPANATWILDATPGGRFGDPRPPTRTRHVPYPPAGYVPYQVVWPRWSFSHPDADFAAATVTMTRNGQPIAARLEPRSASPAGEPAVVWVYDGRDANDENPHPRPAADTVYRVRVAGVRIAGASQDFEYTVTVFDPDAPGPDFSPVAVSGPAAPRAGSASAYAVAKPAFASAFEWRTLEFVSAGRTYTAEAGFEGLLAETSAGYDVVQRITAASGASFRLAHTRNRQDEVLRFPGTYLAGPGSAVSFRSRLGIATPAETAIVQVSTDDGASWTDVYTQIGSSNADTGFPAAVESGFVDRTVSLAAYAGRTISVRLVYAIAASGRAFLPDATNLVGWFVDDLALVDVQGVAGSAPVRVASGTAFSFTPSAPGPVALQARGVMFGAYPLEWGTVASLVAAGDPAAGSYLANLSVRTGAGSGDDTLFIGFAVAGGGKRLLVRGVGPTLAAFGVPGALADPKLELFDHTSAKLAENDNWSAADAPVFASVGAFDLNPGSRDAALVSIFAPGSYTAQLSGNAGGTGIALVELYDTAGGSGPRLSNVSARSLVGTGDNILVVGFNIAGAGPRRLLLRAVGPTLAGFGVGGTLADPKLELYRGTEKVGENDNWTAADAAVFPGVGAFNLTPGSRDAVLVATLPPGSYTAQVSGVNNGTGVALVEVYELP